MMNIARLRHKPKILAALALLLALVISVAAAVVINNRQAGEEPTRQPRQATSTAEVRITESGFEPTVLSVQKGTRIIWTNTGPNLRQVVSNSHPAHEGLPALSSEILNNGQSYEYTADTAGTFGYHDEQNPAINGTLEVRE